MHPLEKLIAANVRNKRIEKNISQEKLGQMLNPPVSFQQIQKFERGVNRISSTQLYDMAQGMSCSVIDFYDKAEEVLAGNHVIVEAPKRSGEPDILIMYEKLPLDIKTHWLGILRALTEQKRMPK